MDNYVTWQELMHFCDFLMAFATLICFIFYHNKKK